MKEFIHNIRMQSLPEGLMVTPPRSPWGINFGGGLDSTAVIIECLRRGFVPNWILFADTGSERPETIEHVNKMQQWLRDSAPERWPDITVVRWVRKEGNFEPLHEYNLRTKYLPSKAYGYSGCTSKYKIGPMDKWRKANGFQKGAFAVGYNASEAKRIQKACQRGDEQNFTAWYPLVAWGLTRDDVEKIVLDAGFTVVKSSCFMCPNMKKPEWLQLKREHPELFNTAKLIEEVAIEAGNPGRGLYKGGLINLEAQCESPVEEEKDDSVLEDRCHHGGCFT